VEDHRIRGSKGSQKIGK